MLTTNQVKKWDSNSPSVCWWEILTILEVEQGSSYFIELVAPCLSFVTRLILLESEFYNSRYSSKSEKRLDSNSPSICWWAILTILEAELSSP
jgi:hypothetical protein